MNSKFGLYFCQIMKIIDLLNCPVCKSEIQKHGMELVCNKKHKFKIKNGVPVMAKLNDYLENEAKAWEDEWENGVSKDGLIVYKKTMEVFRRLGLWEESGKAAGFIPTKKESIVLDLGCGNGLSTSNIKGKFVVGLDLSEVQMIRAKKKFKNTNYVVGDASNIPFKSNSFDVVVAINLLHHIPNSRKVIDEVWRILKPGGRFLTVDPNLYNPIGFIGRGMVMKFGLKKILPTIPQFALGDEERQFSKKAYYNLFTKSKFKNFKITPHRLERIFFFVGVVFPVFAKLPFYKELLIYSTKLGNLLVKIPLIDNICYFWKAELVK